MAGLRNILKQLSEEQLTYALTNKAYYDHYNVVGRSEPLMLTNGEHFIWEYADPCELLRLMLRESKELQDAFQAALVKHPNSEERPWHMIVAYDEFVPGDKLKVNNQRKTMDLIYSFAELGAHVLSLTMAWMMPVTFRHTQLMLVDGGWSRVFCLILRKLFMAGESFGTSGVAVMINGQPRNIYATLHWILADGDGHRQTMCWKGAGGLKPCLIHSNVLSKGHATLASLPDHVDICCPDQTKFKCRTSADFARSAEITRQAHALRQAGVLTQELYKHIEMSEGLTFSALGLPWDEELLAHVDVNSAIAMDWVHSALQQGSVNVEVMLLLDACQSIGQSFAQVEAFLKRPDWQYPTHRGNKMKSLHRVFSEWRISDKDAERKVRCNASELLSLYGLIRNFVQTEVGTSHAELAPQLASFFACCDVIDVFLSVKRGEIAMQTGVDRLDNALSGHMRLHIAAYGTDYILPKHHWLFDVAARLRMRDLPWFLVDCFVLERSHLTARDVADRVKNTLCYERSVIAGVINKNCTNLKRMVAGNGALLGVCSAPMPGYLDARVSNTMQAYGFTVGVGDVVTDASGIRAGVVLACAQEGEEFFAVVEEITLVDQTTPQSAIWTLGGGGARSVWEASRIRGVP